MHMLLQILEEGKLTDSLGRRIDFRNTVVIMTSNIGAEQLLKGDGLGFSGGATDSMSKRKDKILAAAKKNFKPEFMNRVDDIIVFGSLEREDLIRIINIEINKVRKRLMFKGLTLELDDSVLNFLIEKGYQPEFGARPLRRAVEQHLEDALAEDMLKGYFKNADKIEVKLDNQKILFFPSKTTAEEEPELVLETSEPTETAEVQTEKAPVKRASRKRTATAAKKKKTENDGKNDQDDAEKDNQGIF
eukprot:TRINITY_DN4315_c0_g2_i7.p1 TRINITY_DN4315_c0_g2~~TRINITY_DN4315_c0_g2_i7.p1  ORF type:complete len:246 (-),score=35.42 TRINITY_DN4315_c0_g2_i7:1078-1815(-)